MSEIQFTVSHGHWTMTGSYADSGNLVLYCDEVEHSRHTVPGYKIWTYGAHLADIVADLEPAAAPSGNPEAGHG